jgi:hypothetical protein
LLLSSLLLLIFSLVVVQGMRRVGWNGVLLAEIEVNFAKHGLQKVTLVSVDLSRRETPGSPDQADMKLLRVSLNVV